MGPGNADLKARVEAAAGIPVPSPACCNKSTNRGRCTFRKVLAGVAAVCVSFLVVRIAAGITMAIAEDMVYEEEDGTQVVPNLLVILLIFIALLLAQLLILVALKKALECCLTSRSAASSPTACSGTQAPQGGGGGSIRFIPVMPKFAVPQFRAPQLPSFMRREPSRGAYEPLMTDDNTSTELVQTQVAYYEASAPQQHMMYVPPTSSTAASAPAEHYVHAQHVPAQSLSSFSMI